MGAKLLTTKEVEHLVQLNRVTIYRLIRDAGFPALKIGGQWRFPRQEVERWLANHGRVEIHEAPEPPTAPPEPAPLREVPLEELLGSLEIASLLKAFSATVELSILVVNLEGKTLSDCPGCRHPLCRVVHEVTQSGDTCFARRSLQLNPRQIQSDQPLIECISGLHYLHAPIRVDDRLVGYVVMGPLLTETIDADKAQQGIRAFAMTHQISNEALLRQFHTVRRFSNDQVRILTDLLSRVVSTMLETVHRRADAVQRLNTIARLASDM